LTAKQAEATGADGPEGFVVFEGSLARLDEVTSIHPYLTTLRHRLVNEGSCDLMVLGSGLPTSNGAWRWHAHRRIAHRRHPWRSSN
jgi:hypothetical protein